MYRLLENLLNLKLNKNKKLKRENHTNTLICSNKLNITNLFMCAIHHVSPSIMKLIKNTIPQGPRVVSGLNTL